MCRWRGSLAANGIHFECLRGILISRFCERFSRGGSAMAPERMFGGISNFKIMNVCGCFREIFKFRENMSKNRFREISLSVHKIAGFEYFAKVIMYSRSPDHVLWNGV